MRWLLFVALVLSTHADSANGSEPAIFRAGFGEVDITPPIGTPRQGWNTKMIGDSVHDHLFARSAAFQANNDQPILVIALDIALVSVRDTNSIRTRINTRFKIPGHRIMVTATHNHAGPAVIDEAMPRDERWVATMIAGASEAAGIALKNLAEAETAIGSIFEWGVAFNRRVIMRDGTVRTHGSFQDPLALAFEGPVDPEVGVIAVRRKGGPILGVMINYASHPTHHGGDSFFSSGYPGVIARELKRQGIPVALFLQGAAGNISYDDPRGTPPKSMDEMGGILADDVMKSLVNPTWTTPEAVGTNSTVIPLKFREPTETELQGKNPGAQRFGEPGYYERKIPLMLDAMNKKGMESGEVQGFLIGKVALVSQPSESFVEHGLRIKESTWPVKTFVVCYANGMLGYLPHEDAFRRGGYECTFGPPSYMAPETGRLLADEAIRLIKGLRKSP